MRFSLRFFQSGLDFIADKELYDIIFMDIEMPYMNGMDAAKRLRSRGNESVLVFVTNLAKLAVKGYEVEASDFLVKPLRYGSFSLKMDRFVSLAERRLKSSIVLRTNGDGSQWVRVQIDDIYYAEVDGHKLIYSTAQGEFTVWDTMKNAAAALPQDKFVQCNSGCVVNIRHIASLGDGSIVCRGKTIPLSRGKKKEVVAALARSMLNG